MMESKYVGRVIGLFLLMLVAALGVWALIGLQQRGPAQAWIEVTYWLVALSAVVGGLAAFFSSFPRFGWPLLIGLLGQAFGSLIVVGMVMGGGFSGWTLMLWMVSAVGWLLGYLWFFFTFLLILSPSSK
jgi:hypothetical protein